MGEGVSFLNRGFSEGEEPRVFGGVARPEEDGPGDAGAGALVVRGCDGGDEVGEEGLEVVEVGLDGAHVGGEDGEVGGEEEEAVGDEDDGEEGEDGEVDEEVEEPA